MTLDEKLENFYNSAIDDATAQSISIIEEYKNSLHKIYEEHKNEELKKADIKYKNDSDNLLREKNKILSNEMLEIRRNISTITKSLVDNLFLDVTGKIKEFMNTSEYVELLVKQVLNIKTYAKDEAIIIYISIDDEKIKSSVEIKSGCKLTISDIPFIGGTRATILSKNILIDNSFLTKIAECKDTFTI